MTGQKIQGCHQGSPTPARQRGADAQPGRPGVRSIIILLFIGQYLRSLFDLIPGLNPWIYRTITYTALMRDEYPPFRLDQGPTEREQGGADGVDLTRPPS